LLDHKADINALTTKGWTSLIRSIWDKAEETTLLLLERGADVHIKNLYDKDALHFSISYTNKSIQFILLCCGADAKHVKLDKRVTQAKVDVAISEYKDTQAFIEKNHEQLEHTLSTLVEVDTRVGRGDYGIYQEPLERTLEYLGLSMSADQVVNTSIDGTEPIRVLIPNQSRNAKHWYKHYTRQRQREDIDKQLAALHQQYERDTAALHTKKEALTSLSV
jgi:hypothetical protein